MLRFVHIADASEQTLRREDAAPAFAWTVCAARSVQPSSPERSLRGIGLARAARGRLHPAYQQPANDTPTARNGPASPAPVDVFIPHVNSSTRSCHPHRSDDNARLNADRRPARRACVRQASRLRPRCRAHPQADLPPAWQAASVIDAVRTLSRRHPHGKPPPSSMPCAPLTQPAPPPSRPARPVPHRRPSHNHPQRRTDRPKGRPGVTLNRRRPTLPGPCGPSTIGAEGLNCSVRKGKRCFPLAIATGNR